jgi:peptidyl-prolyl cis-trans isomerase B (cyclophilin B)
VSAVLAPTGPDSGGQQFFICVTDQAALDGKYTVFARVVEGIEVVEKLSSTPVDAGGRATDRVTITTVTIRDTPPPEVPPFTTETLEELSTIRAVLETSMGDIRVELFADRAPNHVRNFLRLAGAGVYDGTPFHRVVPGFVVQTGSMAHRSAPLTQKQQRYVGTLSPEFSPTKHEKGILSMARGDDPTSATTSFFICTAPAPALDGQYSIFGRVIDGLSVVDAIEKVPVAGETPVTPVELKRVRVERNAR